MKWIYLVFWLTLSFQPNNKIGKYQCISAHKDKITAIDLYNHLKTQRAVDSVIIDSALLFKDSIYDRMQFILKEVKP